MSQIKDKYFELLVREEAMVKYNIRANDEEQARRIYEEHRGAFSSPTKKVINEDRHIIEIGENNDPF